MDPHCGVHYQKELYVIAIYLRVSHDKLILISLKQLYEEDIKAEEKSY